jgi:PilZ domain/SPOR domain
MLRTERRHLPRMSVTGSAYVNLDPNSGGVILNISEGGLCFQSTAPIQQTETIRFWFSYRRHRITTDEGLGSKDELLTRGISRFIEVGSELAWTDQTRKMGGLRFTNLTAEAREQIRDWIHKSSLVAENEKAALAPLRPSPFLGMKQSLTHAARQVSAKVGTLLRRVRSEKVWTGFSGGVLAGILVSALVVGAISVLTHSRELGEGLIRLGERLGGRSSSQMSTAAEASPAEARPTSPSRAAPELSVPSPDPQPIVSEPQESSRAPKKVAAMSVQSPFPPKLVTTAELTTNTKTDESKFKAANPSPPSFSSPRSNPSDNSIAGSAAERHLASGVGVSPVLDPGAIMYRAISPELELASRPAVHVEPSKIDPAGMGSEKYLEVGKFKEKLLADKTTGKLTQLGFPSTVVQKARLWGKSYQVLVGPYEGDREADAAHTDLVSLGYTPRSYERGRRDFNLPPALKVAGKDLPVGDCVISWESYTPDAVVKIEDTRGLGFTIEGKWVKQNTRFPADAIGYQKNKDGSRTLIEIRFAGMRQALVFANN